MISSVTKDLRESRPNEPKLVIYGTVTGTRKEILVP
jgi:hypothetical protein